MSDVYEAAREVTAVAIAACGRKEVDHAEFELGQQEQLQHPKMKPAGQTRQWKPPDQFRRWV